jgi:hypothetical protein
MIELKQLEWPPLVVGARVRAWLRVRDILMTLLAWLALSWAMRDVLAMLADYLRPPVFELNSMAPPNWNELWRRLQPFSYFIAVLLVWLLCWALIRGRAMRVAGAASLPPPQPQLSEDHAASFGLAAREIDAWRRARVIVVHLGDDGRSVEGHIRQPM